MFKKIIGFCMVGACSLHVAAHQIENTEPKLYEAQNSDAAHIAQFLAHTQEEINKACKEFPVRRNFRSIKQSITNIDATGALLGTAAVGLIVCDCFTTQFLYRGITRSFEALNDVYENHPQGVTASAATIAAAASIFIILNSYTASAYTWSALHLIENAVQQLSLDDFFVGRVSDYNIRAYVYANYQGFPVYEAVTHYQTISTQLNTAQEYLKTAVSKNNKSDQNLDIMCHSFLDVIKKLEATVEAKLQVILQDLSAEYEKECIERKKDVRIDKLTNPLHKPTVNVNLHENL